MSSVRKSFAYATAGKYTEFGLFLIGTVILSRILTPADIGLFAAANSVVAFAQNIRNFGTGDYLVQKKELDEEDIRKTLGVSFIMSWGIAFILAAFAAIIARYFEEPQMESILYLVAFSFLFLPISNITQARLNRDMKMGMMSIISIASSVANIIVAVTLALNGFGAMSIAWATLATNVSMVVFSIVFAPRHTSFIPIFTDLQHVFTFGSWITASAVIRNIGFNGYVLIVGKVMGFASLGVYMRALTKVERFSTILLDVIRTVALPSFAKIKRHNEEPGPYILKALAIMAGFLWPFYAFIGLFSEPIIVILYGYQWLQAVPISQILALSVIVSMNLTAIMPTVMIAYGLVKPIFVFNVIMYSSRIISVLIAVNIGLEAVAWALAISSIVSVPLYLWALSRYFLIQISDVFAIYLRALTLTIVCLLPASAINYIATQYSWPSYTLLLVAGPIYFLVWLWAATKITPAIRSEILKFLDNSTKKLAPVDSGGKNGLLLSSLVVIRDKIRRTR